MPPSEIGARVARAAIAQSLGRWLLRFGAVAACVGPGSPVRAGVGAGWARVVRGAAAVEDEGRPVEEVKSVAAAPGAGTPSGAIGDGDDAPEREAAAPVEAPAEERVSPVDDGVSAANGAPGASPREVASASPVQTDAVAPVTTPPVLTSVVTARRIQDEAPREDLAASASVLVPDEHVVARPDLGALLAEVPGANVTRRGGLGSLATLSLRGANPDEVRVFVDGVPLNQAIGGAVDLSTLPLGDVERVEIYRGVTPLAFGESALGGVVSITTRTPGEARASVKAGAGSFQTMFADASGGGTLGGTAIYGGVHALRAEGNFPYAAAAIPGGFQPGTRQNNDLGQLDGVVRARRSLPGRRALGAGVIVLARDEGLPAREIYRALAARASTTRLLAHADYQSRDDLGASSRLDASLFGSWVRDAFSDPLAELVGVPTATHDVTRSVGGQALASKAVGDAVRLSLLAQTRAEGYAPHNDDDPTGVAGYPARRLVASAGAEALWCLAALAASVQPSARVELSRDVRTGRDLVFGTHLQPAPAIDRALPILRLAATRSWGTPGPRGAPVTLRANVGRYARIPSFLELYGYNRGVIGNPQLRPERGVNADLGVVVTGAPGDGTLTAAVTGFAAWVDDLITWQTGTYQSRADNVARARIAGVESELRLAVGRFATTAQATFTDARDESDVAANRGHQLAHHPRYRGYARVEWREPWSAAGLVVRASADADATAGNNWTANGYGALPPRVLLGANLALEHARSGLALVASGLNLADSRVHDFPGYPLPGRALLVSLSWSSRESSESSVSSSRMSSTESQGVLP